MGIFNLKKKAEGLVPPGVAGAGNRLTRPNNNALTNSAYWSCITLLCSKYATIPLTVHRQGSATPMEHTRLLPQLMERPNKWMSHYEWFYVMGFNYENHGIAIAIKERASNGRIIALYPVSPTTMTAYWTESGELRYRCNTNSQTYSREDLLIISNTPAGYDTVLSPMAYASSDLDLANESKSLQKEYYRGGSVIGRLIKVPMALFEKQKEQIQEAFSYASGFRNIILPDSVQVEPIKVEGDDISKLIQAQQWDVLEVARRFHVPKAYLGDTAGGYGTQEQQAIQFVTECLQPRCKAWEIALTHDLCEDGDCYFKFELQSLMRGDHSARQAWYTAMLTHGVMSVNEVRELEDMEPIGKEGDVHYFQAGFANIKDIERGAFAKDGGSSSSEDKESMAKAKFIAESSAVIFETRDEGAIEKRIVKIAEAFGVTDLSWMNSYMEGIRHRINGNWNAVSECYRVVNATLVKKCQTEGLRYTLDGNDPKEGYFEEDGKKFRNPPSKANDTRIITIWRAK